MTVCHSKTRDLPGVIGSADILVAAIGRAEMIRGSWIKPGATVIDVGTNRLPTGKLVGDVEFAAAVERAGGHHARSRRRRPHDHHHALANTLESARRRAG